MGWHAHGCLKGVSTEVALRSKWNCLLVLYPYRSCWVPQPPLLIQAAGPGPHWPCALPQPSMTARSVYRFLQPPGNRPGWSGDDQLTSSKVQSNRFCSPFCCALSASMRAVLPVSLRLQVLGAWKPHRTAAQPMKHLAAPSTTASGREQPKQLCSALWGASREACQAGCLLWLRRRQHSLLTSWPHCPPPVHKHHGLVALLQRLGHLQEAASRAGRASSIAKQAPQLQACHNNRPANMLQGGT